MSELTTQEAIAVLEAERKFKRRPLTAKEKRLALRQAEERKQWEDTGKWNLIREK